MYARKKFEVNYLGSKNSVLEAKKSSKIKAKISNKKAEKGRIKLISSNFINGNFL